MGMVMNPGGTSNGATYQPKSEKNANSGYVGIGSAGEVSVTGKVGFNGNTPQGKASALTASDTGASLSLVDILTFKASTANHAARIDAIYDCLKKVGLMA